MASDKKSRCWWFVQQLRFLPDNWDEQLKDLMLPGCYIVHDRDIAIADDGLSLPKEPHIHCILEFGSPVRLETVLQSLPDTFAVLYAKPVPNKVGAYGYLMHINDKEKAQYSQDEITHMNGFRVNFSNVYGIGFSDIYDLIITLKVPSFSVLMSLLVEFYPQYIDYVQAHTTLVRTFVQEFSRDNF